ncbi:MAG TPA: hypothetical protein VMW53_07260 [archaeon]|nr:hypothetical protein [archaeon]
MGSNRPSFRVGSNAIASAGTAEQCTAADIPQGNFAVFRSRSTNTGLLYLGNTKAQAEAHHFSIIPAGSVGLQVDNISDVWVDATEDDDVVEWIYEVMVE